MLSIQTNVNSLIAQQNLSVNSAFQSKTIQQLTSGYRINSSGDDAAGLAVANQYRNSVSELTQGVANGNDGVAQLQIMDGGISNISQILDRLKTLATQSSSATFTGDRNVLNNEFQTDITEIDRQAQTIGLNTGGNFAKSLGVYLGGGAGTTAANTLANGMVTVNLSDSTVDSQSLGLTGVQSGNTGYDMSTSNIAAILANGSNTTVSPGSTQFQIYGPGFGSGVDVNVATSAITDGASLVTAINQAITSAGVSNTAFAAAGITASMTTDPTSQNQVLSFSSAGSAFQVRAGDRMANALLGNVTGTTGTGNALGSTLTGNAYNGTFATADALLVTVQGAGLSSPVQLNVTATTGAGSAAATAVLIQQAVAANTTLAAAGITVSNTAGNLNFTSASGGAVSASITGDSQNVLGYGSFVGAAWQSTTATAGSLFAQSAADGVVTLDLSLDGGSSTSLNVTMASATNATADQAVATINAAITAAGTSSAFNKAGIVAVNLGGAIELESTNNTNFRLGVRNDGTNTSSLGFYAVGARNASGLAASYTAPTTPTANFVNQDAKGEYQLGSAVGGVDTAAPLTFAPILYATDRQSLTVSAADASGNSHSVVVSLDQGSGQNIDQAISTINAAIQNSGDATLMQINAVKVNSGTQKIEFESTVPNFSVNVGSTTNGTGVQSQGDTLGSVKVGTGGAADISTQAGAEAAVTAVTKAVSALGVAQAAIGKGENQLTYAVNLAQSQITNLSSAESNIRDADVAQQAANLTKAQVLQQASIAAMAQANSAPQAVLSLLKG